MRAKVKFRVDIQKWILDFTDPITNRRKKKTYPSKGAAELALKAVSVAQVEHKHFEVKDLTPILLGECIDAYVERAKTKKRSWALDALLLRFFKANWADKILSEVTRGMVETYMVERKGIPNQRTGKTISDNTVNKELAALSCVFARAKEGVLPGIAQYMGENPVRIVKKFKLAKFPVERWLTVEEEARLLQACRALRTDDARRGTMREVPHLWHVVEVALNTGFRREEVLSLTWDAIDYKNAIIRLQDVKDPTKELRTVPLNRRLTEALEDLWQDRGMSQGPKVDWVFHKPDGERFLDVKRSFHTAMRMAGITRFRFHDLRHTFASRLVMAGVPLFEVMKLMGHTSMDMTMRYAHLAPKTLKDAVAKLDHVPQAGVLQ